MSGPFTGCFPPSGSLDSSKYAAATLEHTAKSSKGTETYIKYVHCRDYEDNDWTTTVRIGPALSLVHNNDNGNGWTCLKTTVLDAGHEVCSISEDGCWGGGGHGSQLDKGDAVRAYELLAQVAKEEGLGETPDALLKELPSCFGSLSRLLKVQEEKEQEEEEKRRKQAEAERGTKDVKK